MLACETCHSAMTLGESDKPARITARRRGLAAEGQEIVSDGRACETFLTSLHAFMGQAGAVTDVQGLAQHVPRHLDKQVHSRCSQVSRATRTPHENASTQQPFSPRLLPPRASDASRTLGRKLAPLTFTRVYGSAQSPPTTISVTACLHRQTDHRCNKQNSCSAGGPRIAHHMHHQVQLATLQLAACRKFKVARHRRPGG